MSAISSKTILNISVGLLIALSSQVWGKGQQAVYYKQGAVADLDDIVPSYEVKNNDMYYAAQMLSGYVSIGIEHKFYGPGERPRTFSLKLTSATLQGILNALSKNDPDYFWEMEDNVVNIFPKATLGKDKYSASVLNNILPKVEISVKDESPAVKLAVIQLVKIIRAHSDNPKISLTEIPVNVQDYLVTSHTPGYSITVNLTSPTIRQALNAIIKSDPPSIWHIEYFEDGIVIDAVSSHAHRRGILVPAKKDFRQLPKGKRKIWGMTKNR